MKNILLFLCILFILLFINPLTVVSQRYGWSEPIPITDTISNNTNAAISFLYFIENDIYMFWEKSSDTYSTSICYKQFYDSDEVEILQSNTGVHYKNPQLIDTYNNQNIDTNFIILYEEDTKGYNDISFQIYTSNGFTSPAPLTSSPHAKTKLLTSYFGDIVWIEQNKVMFMKYDRYNYEFSEPIVLDSGNCSYPSVNQSGWWGWDSPSNAAWIKHDSDSAHIMQKTQNFEGEWLDTENIFTGKECTNLSFSGGFGFAEMLSWDHYNGTDWHINIYHPWEEDIVEMEFSQEVPYSPFVFSGDIPVKGSFTEGIAFLSFISNTEEQTDVLVSELFWLSQNIEDYDSLSEPGNQVQNIRTSMGKSEPGCKQYFINIWEEKVNDNWQLKYTTMWTCLSDLDEIQSQILAVEIYPNPMKNEIVISFEIERNEHIKLSVSDILGNQIEVLENNSISSGNHAYKWDGSGYPNGLYFVSLQTDSNNISKKIILLK